jgi:hypothetical protein
MTYQTSQPSNTPKFTHWILTKLLKNKINEEQVGDLLEEYQDRAKNNVGAANNWVHRQAALACLSVISKALTVERLAHYALYILSAVLFATLILFVGWLSHMDEAPAEHIWSALMEGKVHQLLLEPLAWQSMLHSAHMTFDIGMYIHIPSIIWASLSLVGLFYVQKKQMVSILGYAALGLAAIALPYLWSLAYIATHDLVAKEVGPIIAFGVISALYLILPVTHRVLVTKRELNRLAAQ